MADAITGSVELDPVKQEIVREIVQRELKEAVTLLPTITDMSASVGPGMKSVKIPKLTSFNVIDRASGAAGDATALTSTFDTLLLDKNFYVAWVIDAFDEIQANIPAQLEYAKRAAAAQGRRVDLGIVTEMETVGVATGTAGNITRDIVLEMRESLLKRNASKDQMFLAVSPDQEAFLLKIAEFSSADVYGSAVIPSGFLGRIFGVNLILNNQLADQQYFMYDREGVAIAFQKQVSMSDQGSNEFGTSARRFAMDQFLGIKGMQLGVDPKAEGLAATESPLVVKDNN